MKIVAILMMLLIFLTGAIAQTNFKDGYLVSLENDTIYGQVDYRPNSVKNETIRFRQENMITEYLPQQISGFGYLNDVYFTSRVVNDLFVEVIVSGELSLYKYKDAFLMGKNGSEIAWMTTKKDLKEIKGNLVIKEDTKWRGIINYLIFDCIPDAGNIAKNIQFHEKELIDITIKYNSCKGSQSNYLKESRPLFKFDYGLAIGLTNSNVHSNDVVALSKSIVLSEKYTSIDPIFGIAFSFSLPRINESLSLQSGIHFSNMDYSEMVKISTMENEEAHYSFIGLTSLSFPLTLKYNVPKGINSIFIQAGINFDYHLKRETTYFYEDISNSVININPESEPFEIKKIQRKILLGAGVARSFNSFNGSVELNYYPPYQNWHGRSVIDDPYIYSIHNNRITLSIIVSRK